MTVVIELRLARTTADRDRPQIRLVRAAVPLECAGLEVQALFDDKDNGYPV